VGCTSRARSSRSTTSQRCSIGLRSGDCGGHSLWLWMDGWMDGWMYGCMDGWTEGWIGGWMSIRLKQSQRKNNAYSSLFSENLKILKILTSEISHIQYVLHTDNYCSHILTYYDCNIIIFTKLQEKFSVLFNSCSINNSKAPSPKPITPPENYRF